MAIAVGNTSLRSPLHKQDCNHSKMCKSITSHVSEHDFGNGGTQELPVQGCELSLNSLEYNVCTHCRHICSTPQSSMCLEADHYPFSSVESYYTICQVRHHCTADSAWLVVGDTIYDASSYLSRHPGGAESILRKSGGRVDCTVDFEFHSKKARGMWKKHKVGKLRPCSSKGQQYGVDDQCSIS
jgi:cytochrome b involved in lipid metabolism